MLRDDGRGKGFGALVLAGVMTMSNPASAERLDAGFVALEMEASDRFSFVSGIIEGLAFAATIKDQNEFVQANCIYGWFYEEDGTFDTIMAAFAKFQDRQPAMILNALIQRRCGA